jgi:hypothetical protein
MDARIRESHLGLLGEPHAHVVVSRQLLRGLEFDWQGHAGCIRNAPVDRRPGRLITEGVVSTALGIRRAPRRHAVPVHTEQRGNGLAVAGVSTRGHLHGMPSLPLLAVGFTLHAALQFVGTFDNQWHRFSHPNAPPCDRVGVLSSDCPERRHSLLDFR